jgi:hypothetical protein
MILGFITLQMRDFTFFSFGWIRDAAQEEDAAVGRQLPALHGDGLVKLQGCAHELCHLAVITPQFALGLAVG